MHSLAKVVTLAILVALIEIQQSFVFGKSAQPPLRLYSQVSLASRISNGIVVTLLFLCSLLVCIIWCATLCHGVCVLSGH
jgi:hypothetical protein